MQEQQVHQWMEKARRFLRLDKLPPLPRKIIVCLAGGIFLLAGIVMVVAPGPAFVFIPLGLLLLASEFKWAEDLVQKVFNWFRRLRQRRRQKHAARCR